MSGLSISCGSRFLSKFKHKFKAQFEAVIWSSDFFSWAKIAPTPAPSLGREQKLLRLLLQIIGLKLFNLANFPSKIYVTQPTDDPIQYFNKKIM